MEHLNIDDREQWLAELDSPLPGDETAEPSEEVMEKEGQDFMALMQMTGGHVGAEG